VLVVLRLFLISLLSYYIPIPKSGILITTLADYSSRTRYPKKTTFWWCFVQNFRTECVQKSWWLVFLQHSLVADYKDDHAKDLTDYLERKGPSALNFQSLAWWSLPSWSAPFSSACWLLQLFIVYCVTVPAVTLSLVSLVHGWPRHPKQQAGFDRQLCFHCPDQSQHFICWWTVWLCPGLRISTLHVSFLHLSPISPFAFQE
jgi:hypothetical protein